jgi:hypothetical protein
MTYDYNAKTNYYDFLLGPPRAWELIYPISAGVKRGDIINVIEVDSGGTPTGNTMTGTVVYISTEVVFKYKEQNQLLYVIPD